jgi:hypothetical protein
VRDAVLAAEEDRLEVHVLDPLPGLERGVEHRRVVCRRDPGVVEEHVDVPELLARLCVHARHLVRVRHVGLQRQVGVAVRAEVDPYHGRALRAEERSRLGADAAGRARHHTHLPVEPSRLHRTSSVA